jgi:hypothetical protein
MDAEMQQQAAEGHEKIHPNQLTNLFPEHAEASSLPVFSWRGIKPSILNKLLFTFYQKESDECKDFHGVESPCRIPKRGDGNPTSIRKLGYNEYIVH